MKLIDSNKLLKDIKENMDLEHMQHEDIVRCIEDSINRQTEIEITEKKKIEYHVYGRIAREAYELRLDTKYFLPIVVTEINEKSKAEILNKVKDRIKGSYINKNDYSHNLFSKIIYEDGYKLYKVINSDIELKTNDFISIDGKDYSIVNIYNSDKDLHEIYLNDFIYECSENNELREQIKVLESELIQMINDNNEEIIHENEMLEKLNKLEEKDKKEKFIIFRRR